MRILKGLIAGALALGGLMLIQSEASAQPMTPPALIHVSTGLNADGAAAAKGEPCYYYYHRWHPHYGWHRPWGWRPVYYGWHPHYWHPHYYGWHRWHRW